MKRVLFLILVGLFLSGCKSEKETTIHKTEFIYVEIEKEAPCTYSVEPCIDEPATPEEPDPPITEDPPTIEEPPEPEPDPDPVLPIFYGDGITSHTQQPYSGTVNRGGDIFLKYDPVVDYFHDIELPTFTVTYRWDIFYEWIITNGAETLCIRYLVRTDSFGYGRDICQWSDTRADVPIDDIRQAYWGYSVVENRVYTVGVVGLWVGVEL